MVIEVLKLNRLLSSRPPRIFGALVAIGLAIGAVLTLLVTARFAQAADNSRPLEAVDILSIVQSAPATAFNGDYITYTLLITNHSATSTATNVNVRDILPLDTLEDINCPDACEHIFDSTLIPEPLGGTILVTVTRQLSWTITSLAPNTGLTLTFWGRITGQADGTIFRGNAVVFYLVDGAQGVASSNETQTTARVPIAQNGTASLSAAPTWFSADLGGTLSQDWADYNNDGNLDLALGSSVGTTVYRNNSGRLVRVAGNNRLTYGVRWADFNGDGILDLATVGASVDGTAVTSGTTYIYDVSGNQLIETSVFTTNFQMVRLAAVDIDGDQDVDIIASTNTINALCPVRLFRNDGAGHFTGPGECVSASATAAIGPGDFNNDGYPDLALGEFPNAVRLYVNEGTGHFTATTPITSPIDIDLSASFLPYDFSWGDYNGDGYLDLAAGFPLQKEVRIYPNQGGVSFAAPIRLRTAAFLTPLAIDWVDFNGDGQLDLAVADSSPRVYLNSGGAFDQNRYMSAEPVSGQAWSVRGVQLTAASDLQLSLSNRDHPSILFGGYASHLSATLTAIDSSPASSLAWGDANSDGQLDLLLGTGPSTGAFTRLYRNQNGTFPVKTDFGSSSLGPHSVAFGDVNGDGQLDIALGNAYENQIYLANNNTSPDERVIAPVSPNHIVSWGDANGDGKLDLLAGGNGSPVMLFLNQGGLIASTPAYTTPQSGDVRSIVWADFNKDYHLDFAVAFYNQPAQVYLNTKNTSFAPAWSSAYLSPTTGLAVADYNADGYPDLALSTYGQGTSIYENINGAFGARPIWTSLTLSHTTSLAWGDWNNDGTPDLALGNDGEPTQVYANLGSLPGLPRLFWLWQSAEAYQTTGIAWGDYDGDGYLDLGLSQKGSGQNGVYRNTTIPTGKPLPTNPNYLSIHRPGLTADGYLFSSGEILASPLNVSQVVTVTYKTYDPNGTRVFTTADVPGENIDNNFFDYSLDGGGTWKTASPVPGASTLATTTSRLGRIGYFVWDAKKDQAVSDNALFRIRTVSHETNGPVQRASAIAVSPPFRVRALTCLWPESPSISYAPINPALNTAVSFYGFALNASGSVTYTWDFGDGSPMVNAGFLAKHTYVSNGAYTVTLSITGEACPVARTIVAATNVHAGTGVTDKKVFLPFISRNSFISATLPVLAFARADSLIDSNADFPLALAAPLSLPAPAETFVRADALTPEPASVTAISPLSLSAIAAVIPQPATASGLAPVEITTSTLGTNSEPSLNSDGSRLAFWSTGNHDPAGNNPDGNIEIFLAQLHPSGAVTYTQITSSTGSILGGFNLSPSISQDGTRLAFFSDRNLSGQNPDGNFEIYLYDTAALTFTQVTVTTKGFNITPAISGDGKHIVFASDRDLDTNTPGLNSDGNTEIFMAHVGTPGVITYTQITRTGGNSSNSDPKADYAGDRVTFVSDGDLVIGQNTDFSREVFQYDLTNNTLTQFTQSGGDSSEPSSNADGSRVAFVSDQNLAGQNPGLFREIFLATIDSGGTVTITLVATSTTNNDKDRPSISADGLRVSYSTANNRDISLYDALLNDEITSSVGTSSLQPVLSASGTRVAFVSGRAIYVTDYPLADLAAGLTATPTTLYPGENVTYTLTLTNFGPSNAYTVSLKDSLPSLLNFGSASPGCTAVTSTITCVATSSQTLYPNATQVFTLRAVPNFVGAIANSVSVTSTTIDRSPGNNTATFTITAVPVPIAGLTLSSPVTGDIDIGLNFTATINIGVLTPTLPITYVWNADEQSTTTQGSLTAFSTTLPITWSVGGLKTVTVTANNPGGNPVTATRTIAIYNPPPVFTGTFPITASAGGATFTLIVSGTDFVSNSLVRDTSSGVFTFPTTFVSRNVLTATIPASRITAGGALVLDVYSPQPGGGFSLSASRIFTITNPDINLVPATGNSMTTNSAIYLTVTFPSPQALSKVITLTATPGLLSVPPTVILPASAQDVSFTVTSLSPGGFGVVTATLLGAPSPAASNVTVNNPVPNITAYSPLTATAGVPNLTLTITGTNFLSQTASVVQWYSPTGSALTTYFVNDHVLTATIPAAYLAASGAFSFTVSNIPPGGSETPGQPFTLTKPSITLAPASVNIRTSYSTTLTLTINAAQDANRTITLATSNPVITVPTTIVLPANSLSITFVITSTTPDGTAIVTATLPANLGSGTASSTVIVSRTVTTINLASNNLSVYGEVVTITANVTHTVSGAGLPTGTLTFTVDGVQKSPVTLVSGAATYTTSTFAVGVPHTVTAAYGGDPNFYASTSSVFTQTVNKDDTTTVISSTSYPNAVFGQGITFTAIVSANLPGAGTPMGSLTFTVDNGTPFTGTLVFSTSNSAYATFFTNTLSQAAHYITATYGGDGNFNTSAGNLMQIVGRSNTTVTVTSSGSSLFGNAVTFTATVAALPPGTGTPTGNVTFTVDGVPLAPVTLAGGQATFVTSTLSVANHSVTAAYGGDANFNTSTSVTLTQIVSRASTTSTVTSSGTPSVYGQSITFTATVGVINPGPAVVTPTGTVTFTIDGSTQVPGTLTASGAYTAVATFFTTTLSVNAHTVIATYGSDSNYNPNTSSAFGQTVSKDNTTSALTSSATPTVYGQSVTFTATVTADLPGSGIPTGTVTFKDGAVTIGTGPLSNGVATYFTATATLAAGAHGLTANYGGNSQFLASTSATYTQTVNQAETAITLTSSSSTTVFSEAFTLTATVGAVSPGSGTPTGTVTIKDGGTPIYTTPLNGGVATLLTNTLSIGGHSFTADYNGNLNFNITTTAAALAHTVNPAATTTSITSTSSVSPALFGQAVTFTATVTAVAPGAGNPSGTLTFTVDSGASVTVTLVSGQASLVTSTLSVGNHIISATYGGDVNFFGSSGAYTQTVNKAGTNTSFASSANSSVFGQSVTLTATVNATAPGAGLPTGTLTFTVDGVPQTPVGLNGSSQALLVISTLDVNAHSIATDYSGDGNFLGGSGLFTQTVAKAGTTVALTSSMTASVFGQSVTFTATVTPVAPGAGVPGGTVTFKDGVTAIATTTLGSGITSVSVTTLSVAAHSLTAVYNGDVSFNTSTSGALAHTVNKANTTINLTSSANPEVFGQTLTLTATVAVVAPGVGTPTGTVTFKNGATTIGSSSLSGGDATLIITNTLEAGNHNLTANYAGNGNFLTSTSGIYLQLINNPAPTIATLSPFTASTGGGGFTLTVTGTNFVTNTNPLTRSVVLWNGAALTTFYVSGTQLTATVPSTNIASKIPVTVTVFNPAPGGGEASPALPLTITDPSLTLAPVSIYLGPGVTATLTATISARQAADRALTVTSSDGAVVNAPASIILTANTLTVTFPVTSGATGGNATITATLPGGIGGATSNAVAVTLTTISLSPSPLTMSANATATLTATVNPIPVADTAITIQSSSSSVISATSPVTITGGSPTVAFTVTSGLVGGAVTLTATLPASLGSDLDTDSITVNNLTPSISAYSPTTATTGGVTFTVYITGSFFVPGFSQALWNNSARVTTVADTSHLSAVISATDLAASGTYTVTVFNPPPPTGGLQATPVTVTVSNPTIALSPDPQDIAKSTNATATLTLTINAIQSAARTITLTTSNSSVAAVPASITLPANSLTVTFNVTNSNTAGTAFITATLPANVGGNSGTASVQTVLVTLNPAVVTMPINSTVVMTVTRNKASGNNKTVKIQTSNSSIANPSSTCITWNNVANDVVSFTLTSGIAGTATITATDQSSTSSCTSNNPYVDSAVITVQNPVPLITTTTPTSATAGGPTFTLRLNGANFVSGVQAYVNGVTRTTTFSSSTQVSVTIPVGDIASPGSLAITATNTSPNLGPSATFTFNVNAPTLTLSPTTGVTITTGGATAVVTASINQTQTTSTVISFTSSNPANLIVPAIRTLTAGNSFVTTTITSTATGGTFFITATLPANLGGGDSNDVTVTVINPQAVLASISPATTTVGGPDLVITLNGSGSSFVTGATAYWNGVALTTAFTNANTLSATLPAANLTLSTTALISVTNPPPNLGASATRTFTVTYPTLSLAPATTITLGSNMTAMVTATLSGVQATDRVLTLTSADNTIVSAPPTVTLIGGSLTVAFPVTGGTTSGSATITATLPAELGSDSSNAVTVTLTTIVLTPATLTLNTTQTNTLTATVTPSLNTTTVITLTSAASSIASVPATRTIAAGQTTVSFTVTAGAVGGTATITATLPVTRGGGTSDAVTITVNNPAPIITTTNPITKIAGEPAFTLVITGSSFITSSQVLWYDGVTTATITPTAFTSGRITVTVSTTNILTATTYSVTVSNPGPGGGTSAALPFTATAPTLTLSPTPITATLLTTPTMVLTATINQPQSVNRLLTLATSNSAAATVASPVTLLAGASTVSFTVTGVDPGVAFITATLPAELGGGDSNGATVNVVTPLPTVITATPTSVITGTPFTLFVTGTNFYTGAQVLLITGTTTYTGTGIIITSDTQLQADFTVSTTGQHQVVVLNPEPPVANKSTAAVFVDAQ
jgi:hypothetical protein